MTNNMVSMDIKPDYESDMPYEPDYCPCLYLSEEQTKALGIDGTIAAGTVLGLNIRAYVKRQSSSVDDESDEDEDVSLTLCVTDAVVVAPPEATTTASAAQSLYGKAD